MAQADSSQHRCADCSAAHDHDDWNAEARGETPMQRADRAYGEILQEVRVAQTGVQILFAFLLALAFQARFASVTGFQRGTYVVTLMLCAAATALLIAPAAFHRVVYRKRLKQHLVKAANRLALFGLVLLLLSLVCAVLLIMDVVLGLGPAVVLAAGMLVWFTIWWFVLPLRTRARHLRADGAGPAEDGPLDDDGRLRAPASSASADPAAHRVSDPAAHRVSDRRPGVARLDRAP